MDRRLFLKTAGLGALLGSTSSLGFLSLAEYMFDGYSRMTDLAQQGEFEQIIEKTYNINVIGTPNEEEQFTLLTLLYQSSLEWDNFSSQIKYVDSIMWGSPIYDESKSGAGTNIFTDTIRVNREYASSFIHELAHVYHQNLPSGFNEKWHSTHDFLYYVRLWENDLGHKTFSAYNVYEDVANLTQNVYRLKMLARGSDKPEHKHAFKVLQIMKESSSEDTMVNKLDLLQENGVCSQHEEEIAISYI